MKNLGKNNTTNNLLRPAERYDNFVNPTNQFGGDKSSLQQTYFAWNFRLGQAESEALYLQNGAGRNVVDIPAWEMVKAGVDFFVTDDQDESLIDDIEAEWEKWDADIWNYKALIESNKTGGGGLVFTMEDGSDQYDQELTTSKGIVNIQVGSRWHLTPLDIERDMFSPNYGLPAEYRASIPYYGTSFVETVHHSRVIRFSSPFTGMQNTARNHGWGESVYTHIINDIKTDQVGAATGGEAFQKFWQYILHSASMEKWKGAKTDSMNGAMQNRLSSLFQKRSINNVAVVQKGAEELTVEALPVQGLVELMDAYPKRVCSSSRIPYDKLYTGESGSMGADIIEGSRENFQDWILARQRMDLAPVVRQWIKIFSTYMGFDPEKVGFKFNKLQQLNPLEEAQMKAEVARHDEIYLNQGVLSPDEVATTRFAGRKPDYTSMRIEEGPRKTLEEIDQMDQEEADRQTQQLKEASKGNDEE